MATLPSDDPSNQAKLNAANVAYITVPAVRQAYLLLLGEAEVRNMETSVLASSGAKPLRFYRWLEGERRYFFSCDRNQTHLRCYVRPPSLRVWPELRGILLNDPLLEAREVNEEVQVVVREPEQSQRLVQLLFDRPEFSADDPSEPAPLRLELVADPAATSEAFAEWFGSLAGSADGDDHLLPSNGIGLRRLRSIGDDELRVEFWVGDSASAAVQINEPNAPGTENPLAGLAIDGEGGRYIVRQGVLHRNQASERIEAGEFATRTGLDPVEMLVDGRTARRQWHVVTPLDGLREAAIAFNTAEFVARCWRARTWSDVAEIEERRLRELFGPDERGGWLDYVPDPSPRRVLRAQGEVWQALSHQLGTEEIRLTKPRHARGYEVDAEIVTRGRQLLLEIKSGAAAADYYCGVGQLMLYSAIMPRLAGHDKILLLPDERTTEALEEALHGLDIQIHRYRLVRSPNIQVRFSAAFLRLCGLSGPKAAEFDAF